MTNWKKRISTLSLFLRKSIFITKIMPFKMNWEIYFSTSLLTALCLLLLVGVNKKIENYRVFSVHILETIPWRTNGYEKKYFFIQTVLIKNPPIALLEQNTVKLHFLIMMTVTIYLKNLLVYL